MNQVTPPPFVEPPPSPAEQPSAVPPPLFISHQRIPSRQSRHLPWPGISLATLIAAFVAGWIVSRSPLPNLTPPIVKYTSEQQAVLDWINKNVGEPDIEIIEFDQRSNADGGSNVVLKYRGKSAFGTRMIWTRYFQVKDGAVVQVGME